MPQATEAQRQLMQKWFGDIDTKQPMDFLFARGYTLTSGWEWEPPVSSHTISREKEECICFLADEWDFGGIIHWTGNSLYYLDSLKEPA